ncbi:hypothetical protein T265_02617 [Opisthorchis viverrini]|uniref:Uncharacterized protein n=1 Tax=Opisthorchis viverrini TaxID=6198 RepID=A0A074ZYI4_OPIVI|nr:hypothetical protein T265_02617 [Opisthorchis viverrini]KER31052.1 hypothetical protein T265_02617 [Opisthorchis viverrini]
MEEERSPFSVSFHFEVPLPPDTQTPLTSISSHSLQSLQQGTKGITRSPSWKESSTDRTQTFRYRFHTPLPGQGLVTSPLPTLPTGHGKQYPLRWFGIRKTLHNQRSSWRWTHSSMKDSVAKPKTRLLIASLL